MKYLITWYLCIILPVNLLAQIPLAGTEWSGKTKLHFSTDSLTAGTNVFRYRQTHDTLIISGQLFRVTYTLNGQVLTLKAMDNESDFHVKLLAGLFHFLPDTYGARRDWLALDPATDSIAGISLYKAYDLLKDRKSKPVIVAVIDNGFDLNHEDLKDVLWTNTKEIPYNSMDDDHNGYIDDIHGWNFRSSRSGTPVPDDVSSATQFYLAWKTKYDLADTGTLTHFEKKQWLIYQTAKIEYLKENANFKIPSMQLIGDTVRGDRFYGSGVIKGSDDLSHGTHVAGIIAAERNNGKGIDGIADNVRIMPIIATTGDGDERDKDVANAIRYAVDNGARIINMSFSKRFSPEKQLVDEAVRYAEQKQVLIVHAAGNDGNDLDTANYYPVAVDENSNRFNNFITVGWSRPLFNERLAHPYSNYGQAVDLFAPGSDILSTIPGNSYGYKSGSSMSTPVVTGVAALLLSYFPKLNMKELKTILIQSVYKPDIMVNRPGSKMKVPFSKLSVSGGIVNAYNAVKMAIMLSDKM